MLIFVTCAQAVLELKIWVESPQLIERKGQVDTDIEKTSRASKHFKKVSITSKKQGFTKQCLLALASIR